MSKESAEFIDKSICYVKLSFGIPKKYLPADLDVFLRDIMEASIDSCRKVIGYGNADGNDEEIILKGETEYLEDEKKDE